MTLRVRVELWPHGGTVGDIQIQNLGPLKGEDEEGHHEYGYTVSYRDLDDRNEVYRGKVRHRRSDGSWALIAKVIAAVDAHCSRPWWHPPAGQGQKGAC
jgi:hypothetical protein